MKPSDRVTNIPPSGIRRFFELAEEADDVISLGVGEPDFSAPWRVRDAAIASLERGQTSYTTNRGLSPLRESISEYVFDEFGLAYEPDNEILVTTGASEAVDVAIRAIIDPGDIVALPEPTYLSYAPLLELSGATILPVPTTEADEFRLTVDALQEVGAAEADVLILCYPNNPTGAIMPKANLTPIAEYVKQHDLAVISDEIYAALTYGTTHTSIATLPAMRERTIVINGFSKAFAMTGLRLGYALAPPAITDAMNRIHQYGMLSAPTTAQYAAIEALDSCLPDVQEMRQAYDRRRTFVLSRLADMDISCFEAKGAFYVFPECPTADANQFAEDLLHEEGVAVVPGDAFGAAGNDHLRVSYATHIERLKEAMNRLERFIG